MKLSNEYIHMSNLWLLCDTWKNWMLSKNVCSVFRRWFWVDSIFMLVVVYILYICNWICILFVQYNWLGFCYLFGCIYHDYKISSIDQWISFHPSFHWSFLELHLCVVSALLIFLYRSNAHFILISTFLNDFVK